MIYAVVEDGVVVNLAVSDTPLADNWIEVVGVVKIGYTWDGENFAPPVIPVEEQIKELNEKLDTLKAAFSANGLYWLIRYLIEQNVVAPADIPSNLKTIKTKIETVIQQTADLEE